MMLHIVNLEQLKKCPRLAWIQYHHKLDMMPFYNADIPFSELWAKAYGIEGTPCGKRGDTNETSLKLMESNDVVRWIRFSYRDLRVMIPWLQKCEGGWKAIYPHMSSSPHQDLAWRMKITQEVAARCGVSIVSHEVIWINKEYVRGSDLDLQALFKRGDRLFGRRSKTGQSIEELLAETEIDLDALIDEAAQVLEGPCPQPEPGRSCHTGRRCVWFDDCFHPESMDGRDVAFLKGIPFKENLGITRMDQLDPAGLEGKPVAYAQYKASKSNPYMNKEAMADWMKDVSWPVSYLDFEWDSFAVPPYPGMLPFDVLCFQYSLHMEQEDGTLTHTSFFASGDCRKDFIESLIESIPEQGTIFVYNMMGAEQLRLKQLARQFPEYEAQLEQIWSRMKDLSKPFENGMYYDLAMKGRFSLKQVVNLFDSHGYYDKLDIRNGLDAVKAYRVHVRGDEDTKQAIETQIDQYCGMDTYAEYLVWHGLQKAMEDMKDA